jgi:hypothetical protein
MVDSRWSKYRQDTWKRKLPMYRFKAMNPVWELSARAAVKQCRAIRPGREIEVELDEGRIMIVVQE